ncbi:MAG: prepilin-type N-terminal cleavage/methylation domain-containing protein [Pirellulaceae bacterium]
MSVRYNAARRGLTLIELVVVLLILVGLAGVVIPAVTNMVGRTHTSSGAANIQPNHQRAATV